MKQSQIDYINFYYLLKGNYRKGVHALRSILADGGQAKAFAENPSAVAVVLSYDKQNPDKNSEELYNLLINSNVSDLASGTYICSTYGVTSFEELAADEEIMAEVAADESSMNAIAASEGAMAAMTSSKIAMAAIAESETAMTAILSTETAIKATVYSETAMNAVAQDSSARGSLIASEGASPLVYSSEMAAVKCVVGEAELDPSGYLTANSIAASATTMQAVASSSEAMVIAMESEAVRSAIIASNTAMSAVAASSAAMSAVAASSAAVNAIIASSSALSTVAASSTAMAAIAASSAAMSIVANSNAALSAFVANSAAITAIEASSTAKSALAASSLVVTKTGLQMDGSSSVSTVVISGKLYVVSCSQSAEGDTDSMFLATRISTNAKMDIGNTKSCYNTYAAVGAFFKNLAAGRGYIYYYGGKHLSVKYIPIS